MGKTIKIDPVTRIEGHARIVLDCDDSGKVEQANFCVNELRGFERILVGMEGRTMPQITARICGVCPTAHHLVAAKALDNAAGVEIPPAAKLLRELMYMGHVIHSHALSLFVLAGPDLLFGLGGDGSGKQSIVGMAEKEPELCRKGLRLRTIGQQLNETLGGRGIHPVTAVAGGISFKLSDAQVARLAELTTEAVSLIGEVRKKLKGLLFQLFDSNPGLLNSLNMPSWYLGTVRDGGALSFYDGTLRMVDEQGGVVTEFSASDYDRLMVERTVPFSYAKEVYFEHGGAEHLYRVSTLARLNVIDRIDTELAQEEFLHFRKNFGRPCHNTVVQLYAKLIELLYACERAQQLVADPALRGENRVAASFAGKRGVAHIEAPRGTLIHDYSFDERGVVRSVNMIIATQQNTAAINRSLKEGAEMFGLSETSDAGLLNGMEFIVRCYDPCLACSTHAIGRMEMDVEIRGAAGERRTVSRRNSAPGGRMNGGVNHA